MKILVASLCVFCIAGLCKSSQPDLNSILLVVTNLQIKDWDASNETNDVFVDWWEYIRNETAVQPTPAAVDLRLSCEADFPIEWNITGDIKYPEVLKVQPNQRVFLGDGKFSYVLRAFIFFEEDSASSSTFHCQSVENSEIRKSLDVFRQGDATKPFINSGKSIRVEDSRILPCSVSNASLNVILGKQNPITGKFETQNVEYNPRYGFISAKAFVGYFACTIIGINDIVNVEATVTRSVVLDHDYWPRKQSIKVFNTEPLRLVCAAKSKFVNIKIKLLRNEENLVLEDTSKSNNHAEAIVLSNATKTNVTAVCENEAERQLVWRWDIEFVEPPELYLNNFEGEVSCLSEYNDRTISTVRCVSPSHCEYMKHCFADRNSCNDKRQKQFFSDDIGFNRELNCWGPELGSKLCVRVPYSHLNGIVECKVRGLTRHWTFFNSLESTKLYDYHYAETSELIQMDNVPSILYTNITTKFLCKSVLFLFADSITFEMIFANSSTQIMEETTHANDENRRRIEEGNVIGELEMKVPLNAVGIRCLAPLANSSEILRIERRFVTRDLQKPTFRGEPDITKVAVSDRRKRLNCSAIGEPKPTYIWRKNGNVLNSSDRYEFITGSNGESLLEFSIIDESVRGEYECEASNNVESLLGNCPIIADSSPNDASNCGFVRASKIFRIEDIQTGSSWAGTAAFSATIAIVLIILICVCILLVYVMQKYLKAKDLIRNLTDNEIDEFFNGNPALLGAKGQLGPEFLDLVPYDNHYELDLDEIQFDLSKVLGEGEFSTVVQGFWVTQSRNVAVKIAKPSTDVSLFKNLLSEVKIMIFIGGHANILSLLGVCTKNIRNRTIYIVMELCNHGSLDILLRKNRKTYINLLDGNQQIDVTKADVGATGTKITTLTLVRWSGEIASGMEFLSYKGVVHADLAARNVLIGPNWEAKVSDFGLSRKLYENTNYVKKSKTPLPWRWMATESLMSLSFSTESDIWSYGVTIWEIFTLGDVPFPNEAWDKEFLNRIASGMRMGKPKYANPEIYSQIHLCWDEDPSLRPNFSIHRKFFLGLYTRYIGEPEPGEHIRKSKTTLRPLSNYTEIPVTEFVDPNETEITEQPHLYGNVDLVGNELYSNAQR